MVNGPFSVGIEAYLRIVESHAKNIELPTKRIVVGRAEQVRNEHMRTAPFRVWESVGCLTSLCRPFGMVTVSAATVDDNTRPLDLILVLRLYGCSWVARFFPC